MSIFLSSKVLVLGGCGFIGSRVARLFNEEGWKVTILDGLIEGTGGCKENIQGLSNVDFLECAIESVLNLEELISPQTLVIDAMGWTRHLQAVKNPLRDLHLNVRSHVHWLSALPPLWKGKIIYLGSRGQYGNPNVTEIIESTPQVPDDVQGIHKLAAELHFRFAARHYKIPIASLRFPAAVGLNQPLTGDDIGLFGGFIRDLIRGNTVEIYGNERRRAVTCVDDIAKILFQIAHKEWSGFEAFNVAGQNALIHESLEILQRLIGGGSYKFVPLPEDIRTIDIGSVAVSEAKLNKWLGSIPRRSLEDTLLSSVQYIQQNIEIL